MTYSSTDLQVDLHQLLAGLGYHIVGDQVMYWRKPSTKAAWAGAWHGPGVIIGTDGPNYWLAHRGTTLKAQQVFWLEPPFW